MVTEQMCMMSTDGDDCLTHECSAYLQCYLASCPHCIGDNSNITQSLEEGHQKGAVACTVSSGADLPSAMIVDTGVPLHLF